MPFHPSDPLMAHPVVNDECRDGMQKLQNSSPHQERQLSTVSEQPVPATNFHTKRQKPARGNVTGRHVSPKIAVSFDQSMFDRIAGEAARREMPFGAVVREKLLAFYSAEGR